jgi:hypothetical protein
MMEEKTITLDEKDARRLTKIKKVLEEATEVWDRAVKLIIPEYLEEFKGKNVEVASLNPETKVMTIKIDDPGGEQT